MTATSSSTDTYSKLRAAILSGEFGPNERLVEADLVKALDASRGAVRAAILRLDQEGLVSHERNRGAKVRRVEPGEAVEILQARAALEALGAREAAHRADERDLKSLRSLLKGMEKNFERGDLRAMSDRNAMLHTRILEISAHATVARLVASLSSQLVRYQYRTILIPGRAQRSLAEHSAIVDAIEAGDGDAAERLMRRHLERVTRALREAIEAQRL